jgi:hypothetical protein
MQLGPTEIRSVHPLHGRSGYMPCRRQLRLPLEQSGIGRKQARVLWAEPRNSGVGGSLPIFTGRSAREPTSREKCLVRFGLAGLRQVQSLGWRFGLEQLFVHRIWHRQAAKRKQITVGVVVNTSSIPDSMRRL